MKLRTWLTVVGMAAVGLAWATSAEAVTLTFNNAISGATTYSFDADLDGLADAIFSTTDPFGFNTVGPGPNMTYINEPGLEGTVLLNPDLRVDFPVGALASGGLSFGFALNTFAGNTFGCTFKVYDSANTLLASNYQLADFTTLPSGGSSTFPEAMMSVSFAGTASYALFDFDNDPGRYIIDNFTGTFGTTEVVPEPLTITACLMGLAALGLKVRRRIAA